MNTCKEIDSALKKMSFKYHTWEHPSCPDDLWTDEYTIAYDCNHRGTLFKFKGSWFMFLNLYNNNEAGEKTAELNKASQDAFGLISASWFMPVALVDFDRQWEMLQENKADRKRRGLPGVDWSRMRPTGS